jgi:hypothetical protein
MKEGKAKSANGYKVSLEGDENMLTLECDDSYNSEEGYTKTFELGGLYTV